jgi:hypothetical protein
MFASKDIFITKNPTSQYLIAGSLAFGASQGTMSRTNVTPTNNKIFTISFWYKPVNVNFNASTSTQTYPVTAGGTDYIRHLSTGQFSMIINSAPLFTTTGLFYDQVWYHIVMAVDTTQATAAAGQRLFINGRLVPGSHSGTWTQNAATQFNSGTVVQYVGRNSTGTTYESILTDYYFLDGVVPTTTTRTINQVSTTVLTMFGEWSGTTGVWTPKAYTGSYGANGGLYKFTDTTSTSTLGNDTSGNGNNFTTASFVLSNDILQSPLYDSPTVYTGSDGIARGNYDVVNACTGRFSGTGNDAAFSRGKTLATNTFGGTATNVALFDLTGGDYYWEVYSPPAASKSVDVMLGDYNNNYTAVFNVATSAGGVRSFAGFRFTNSSRLFESTTDGTNWTTVATVSAATSTSWQRIFVTFLYGSGGGFAYNPGTRPYNWTKPTGYNSICVANFSTPSVVLGTDYVRMSNYTGTAATQSIDNTSNSFTSTGLQPDIVWIFPNSASFNHVAYDVAQGVTKAIDLSATTAITTKATGLTTFNSNGFSLGSDTQANNNTTTYAAAQFVVNASAVTNTSGSVNSTVRANTSIGTSIVTFTSPASGTFTVGHGLNVAPEFIMLRSVSATGSNWFCYHVGMGNTKYFPWNSNGAEATSAIWNNTTPTSTVVSFATSALIASNAYEMYCFNSVKGYSSFSYQLSDSSPTFYQLGFSPTILVARLLIAGARSQFFFQGTTATNNYWNPRNDLVQFWASSVTGTWDFNNFASSGQTFYLFSTGAVACNLGTANNQPQIYMAWGSVPSKYAIGR